MVWDFRQMGIVLPYLIFQYLEIQWKVSNAHFLLFHEFKLYHQLFYINYLSYQLRLNETRISCMPLQQFFSIALGITLDQP